MKTKDSKIVINDYDKFLFDVIPHLSKFKSHEGGEGSAYFVDRNFVVKEYSKVFPSRDIDKFDLIFDSYCKEMQSFAEEGYSVPRVYSWLKIPNTNKAKVYLGDEMPYKYYVLQENVPGRWIYYFFEDLDEMYITCKNILSKDDFMSAFGDDYGKMPLKHEILKAYISDYIKVNSMLESMGDDQFEKFIVSGYKMAMEGVYSSPDLFRKNVLLTDSRLTLIDNQFRDNAGITSEMDLSDYFVLALVDLIEYNKFTDENLLLNSSDRGLYSVEIAKLLEENRNVCIALTQKMFNILNKKIGVKPIKNPFVYEDIEQMIASTFKEDKDKILPMVQTEFEK